MAEGLPESISLRLDDSTRRSDRGRTFIGGSPLRVLRLTDTGARIADELAEGKPVGSSRSRQTLARRLLDGGLAHPLPSTTPQLTVTVVVPVRDHADGLRCLVESLGDVPMVVVDDGSSDSDAVIGAAGAARVIRHDRALGPAAARNAGWRAATTDLVAFVDADVVADNRDDWIEEWTEIVLR